MRRTYQELTAEARSSITEITADDLAASLGNVALIDIRELDEYQQGTIPGARFIPRGILESSITEAVPDLDTPIVLYCSVGARSAFAAQTLEAMGYQQVSSLAGGSEQWKSQQRPWEIPDTLPVDQLSRYSRHVLLPEVGEKGQRRLLESRVLVVGAGGLGSPAALYLAAAGVGTLGIVDFDVVDVTNLQRQILHNTLSVGTPKTESAQRTLTALNPDVRVVPHATRLTADNVLDLITGFDLIVDGADNFPTRYLLNDAALHTRTPVVHGSIFRFEGQATVFTPYEGPCYRCLYSEPPPPELAPSCAEAGVLGVLPGVIGSIQATEAIKLLLGIGDTLAGRLLLYDALDQDFRTLNLRRDPDCPACSDESRPPKIVEYDQLCTPAGTVARH